jgi:hypothetical protein
MRPFLTLLTALLLAFLSVLHADDAPSKQNAGDAIMLAGDWVPVDPHQIDYDKLPRVTAEHATAEEWLRLDRPWFCGNATASFSLLPAISTHRGTMVLG